MGAHCRRAAGGGDSTVNEISDLFIYAIARHGTSVGVSSNWDVSRISLALRLGKTTLLASPAYSFPQLRSLEHYCTPITLGTPRLDDDSLLFLLRSSSVSFCHFVSVLFHFLTFFLRRAFRLQKGSGFSLKFLFWFFFSFFLLLFFIIRTARDPAGTIGTRRSARISTKNKRERDTVCRTRVNYEVTRSLWKTAVLLFQKINGKQSGTPLL